MISKRTIVITVILVVSVVVGGLIGFYFYTKNNNPSSTIVGKQVGRTNFGGYNPDTNQNNLTSTSTPIIEQKSSIKEVKIPKLRKINATPTAGFSFITTPIYEDPNKNIEPADTSVSGRKVPLKKPLRFVGASTTIRFIERGTGHIYETSTSTVDKKRITNTTEPKIYEAYFVEKGDSLIVRGLIGSSDIISTRYVSVFTASTSESVEKTLEFKDLPIQISDVAISPSKTQLFSIMSDGVRGILSKIDGGATVGIFDTPYKEWIPTWPEEKNIVLTTKASAFAEGFSYILNTQTKQLTRILGNIYGLTTLASPDISKILYSSSEKGSFTLHTFNRSDSSKNQLPLNTLPEKCVWAKKEKDVVFCAVPNNIAFSTYPDIWYQGLINFSDSIWKINVISGETRLISNTQEESSDIIDGINLQISDSDDYLIFTNKTDLSMWGLQLVEPIPVVEINPLNSIKATSSATSTR